MKKMNKKGFTIVELVIVIAVIAILAAVMIPTFSSIITDAQDSADMQEARNKYTEYLLDHPKAAEADYVKVGDNFYDVDDFDAAPVTSVADAANVVEPGSYSDYCVDEDTNNACDECEVTKPAA